MSLPRIIRHHYSGIWVCYLLGEGEISSSFLIEGRRVYSWKGKRLETSQLATLGIFEEDKLGDWVRCSIAIDGLIDCIQTTKTIVEHCRSLPCTRVLND